MSQRGACQTQPRPAQWKRCTAALLLALCPGIGLTQAAGPQAPPPPAAPAPAQTGATPAVTQGAPAGDGDAKPEKQPRSSDKRRAAKIFMEASKLFEKKQFEEALHDYQRAAALDPTNRDYFLAAQIASSHAVTALIQSAAQDRIRGDEVAERAALEHALALDPRNVQVTQHLYELGDEAARRVTAPLYDTGSDEIAEPMVVEPKPGANSFHLHLDERQTIQQVFKAYGLIPTVDDSVPLTRVRFDLDDASFEQAAQVLGLVTNSFYVPLDAHRVLIARDTQENRRKFERLELETIYLPGLPTAEMTEVETVAKTVFELQQAKVDPSSGTLTVRGAPSTLKALNSTLRELIDGHSQVLLDVDLIQLAHTSDRNTGVQPPQSISAFNVYAEEQSILNANQSLVQQIISSGLASSGDTLAILAILIASGQVSSSLFSSGLALFGGGITQSALSPGSATFNLNLNSSDSKQLDHIVLRLSDGANAGSDNSSGTIKSGTSYPIQTSSFSSLGAGASAIAGLTGAGTSSSLSSLLGSLGSSVPNVPQVEYKDLGLTLKATPRVMRDSNVALTVDLKITALSGQSINGNPVLNSRAYSGITMLRQGEGIVVASELDQQESRAISGVPGLSEIPGLNDVTDKDVQRSKSTLLIVMTPHIIRGTQAAGHSPMMRIERSVSVR
jgi:general secretion pathway protein D